MILSQYFTTDDISTYTNSGTLDSEADTAKNIVQTDLTGIFGIPYQFLDSVDIRPNGSEIGEKYAEKIVSKIPLLFLTPCRQKFMAGFDKTSKAITVEALATENASLTASLTEGGKYYTTEFAFDKYYEYVNVMCHQLAYFLGIANETVTIGGRKSKVSDINWQVANNDAFRDYFLSGSSAVVFYADGLNTLSDTFSNESGESSLASTINGYSTQANEIRFLLGSNSTLTNMMEASSSISSSLTSGLAGTVTDFAGGMLGDLANKGVSTVLTGGKIIFPKIWQDSQYGRSYDFDIKLRSPDHDSLSIYLNLLAPYIHLLCLVLPVGIEDNPNGYTAPFLVKAFCKGMFNIDMGLISSLSVSRGGECQWNDDGLPTQIDVSLTIDDLYSSLFMTNKADAAWSVANNTAMMDYLCNMAGINIADMEVGRRVRMLAYMTENNIFNIDSKLYNWFDNSLSKFMATIYSI